ncbi:cysteine desulfurase [Shinella curvata]|uniref:Cysteine desulfurase n=1 Tax=Shinella curvata TaxID=1817964 RepID=A0ABT8X8P7_9HYPH|nr:cysteine desulfurase family protein [Shinella curvata]MCJ8051997.1 cysteine desulfurase [Shinella curvata]MDO6120055.1 cysteine desulfurase [Shinella curvata]
MTKTERTYLDWNATAPLLPAAREAVVSALDMVGNPSSVHGEGRALRMLVEAVRRDVAALVNTAPAHVIFTSGATEAANLVLTPNYRMGRTPLAVGHLYASEIEHPAIREGGRFSRDDVTMIPVTRAGIVDLDALDIRLKAHDKARGLPMVAVMLANNETGIVQPVRAVADIVHRHGGLLIVDAVQAVGRMPVDIEALDADFLIISSHKLGGPKGVGALVSRGEVLMPVPLIRGGGQEKGHRSGTENPAALAGFAAAARAALADLAERNARISGLRDALEDGMRTATNDVIIHGAEGERVANTSFFSLPGLKSETGQIAFDLEGIALSAGSACSSGKVGQSHVLTAMGFDATLGGLRVSLGPDSTEADVERFLAAFSRVVSRRRAA